jgi:hypothetical protein
MAVELEISFGAETATELDTDIVRLCKDDACTETWGSYSGTVFPGKGDTSSLFIPASVVYLKFSAGVNTNSLWGYAITVTPYYGMFIIPLLMF